MSMIATMNTMIVFVDVHHRGPIIMRTAFRSLVARDIRSPVRCAWKFAGRERLQPREEVVAQVVLEVPRHADDDAAHQEAEDAPEERQHQDQAGVRAELRAVTPCARSSMACLSTQGVAREATVASVVHARPSANPRR